MKNYILSSLAGLLVLGAATGASAQTVCNPRAEILTQLSDRYKEAPTGMGLTASGQVLELLSSENGTWTIIVTNPQGVSCVLAVGEAWEEQARVLAKTYKGPPA